MEQENVLVENRKGFSITSMVLGIVSLVMWCITYVSVPAAIVGLILGIIGRKRAGKGMALAGIVTSIIALSLGIIFTIIGISSISLLGESLSSY